MLTRPRFKPGYRVEIVGGSVLLLGERTRVALSAPAYRRVAPLLDGVRDVDEIVRLVHGSLSPLEVHAVLERLERRGVVCEAVPERDGPQAAFWSAQDLDPAEVAVRLKQRYVAVRAIGSGDHDLAGVLARSGVRVWPEGPQPSLTVIVTGDYAHADLARHNRDALRDGLAWMLVKPGGTEPWIGPVFVPGETGCWRCLADRIEANRPVEAMIRHRLGNAARPPAASSLPSTVAAIVSLAAVHVHRRLAADATELDGELRSVHLATLGTTRHVLVRRPQCSACGVPEPARSQPIVLRDRHKAATTDGGHRAHAPATTLRRLEHHISPITGIVRGLTRFDTPSELMSVYRAAHPFGGIETDGRVLLHGAAGVSHGKGMTDAQSRASAVGEAIERYCGVYTGLEDRRTATWAEIGDDAVHPAVLLQVSEAQLRGRDEWNRSHSAFAWVPQPFREERELEWTPAWSFTEGRFKSLPTAFCFYGYPLADDHEFCRADSNGNASGSTIEDAILQGFLELVERDSVALWWYSRARRPAVDLDAVDDAYAAGLRRAYGELGRELWALDVTSDLGIPVVAAVSRRVDGGPEHVIQGYGCHFDPAIALGRALTELNQMLAIGQGDPGARDPDNERWFADATIENQPYLVPDPSAAHVPVPRDRSWSANLRDDVESCVEIVAEHGMELLVLDQSRPDVGVPVVKVVVPGMRHFWPRFGPGRLYDVPARLGWVDGPLAEGELNPIPISS